MPRGEWWIDGDGYAQFADGDVGDMNHEMIAFWDGIELSDEDVPEGISPNGIDLTALGEELLSELGVRDDIVDVGKWDEEKWKELLEENDLNPFDKNEGGYTWNREEVLGLNMLVKLGANMDFVWWWHQSNSPDSREYAMEKKNWIRVQGFNFEMGKFDDDALDRIRNAEIWEDDLDDDGNPREHAEEVSIYDNSGTRITPTMRMLFDESLNAEALVKLNESQAEIDKYELANKQYEGEEHEHLALNPAFQVPPGRDEYDYTDVGHDDGGISWVWDHEDRKILRRRHAANDYWHFKGRYDPKTHTVSVLSPDHDEIIPEFLLIALEHEFGGGLQAIAYNPIQIRDEKFYDPNELAMGIEVEAEHTDDLDERSRIARQHLEEDKHYYTKLRKAGLNPDESNRTVLNFANVTDAFEITTPDGARLNGYIRNADFPNDVESPTRGELFYLEVPDGRRRRGLGMSLALDGIDLLIKGGAKTVNLSPQSRGGRSLVDSLIRQGVISPPIRISKTGKSEHLILVSDNPPKWRKDSAYEDFTEMIPIETALDMREFDRLDPQKMISSLEYINELREHIRKHGILEPIIIGYFHRSGLAVVIEGNHRIALAAELGLKAIPARVTRYNGVYGGPDGVGIPAHAEPDRFGYIPGDMKPSDIGIKTYEETTSNPPRFLDEMSFNTKGIIVDGKLLAWTVDGRGNPHHIDIARDLGIDMAVTTQITYERFVDGNGYALTTIGIMLKDAYYTKGEAIDRAREIMEQFVDGLDGLDEVEVQWRSKEGGRWVSWQGRSRDVAPYAISENPVDKESQIKVGSNIVDAQWDGDDASISFGGSWIGFVKKQGDWHRDSLGRVRKKVWWKWIDTKCDEGTEKTIEKALFVLLERSGY